MELIHASATAIFTRMTPSGAQDMVVPHGAINADHTQFIVEDRKNGPPCLALPCLANTPPLLLGLGPSSSPPPSCSSSPYCASFWSSSRYFC